MANKTSAFAELGLSNRVLAAVEDLGYSEPTPVQRDAIPHVLRGEDVAAAAQTGSGKTAAFLLSALDKLDGPVQAGGAGGVGATAAPGAPATPHMLVLVPTRELAYQVSDVAHIICAHTGHACATVVGGVGYDAQLKALSQGCDVLVATPGRLIDLMERGACHLGEVRVLVLDEADRMLDMGFLPSVEQIVASLGAEHQTLLFSATLSPEVWEGFGAFASKPVVVQTDARGTTARNVAHYVLRVEAEAKKRVLVQVLRREGAERVIVFVRGRHRADHLSRILEKKGFKSAAIHGGRTQGQRMRALERFQRGEVGVLVATDVLARGIDVDGVAYVVNVDVPQEPQSYVHRIGRTGRARELGWALTLCATNEYNSLRAIQRLIGFQIPPYPQAEGLDVGTMREGHNKTRKA